MRTEDCKLRGEMLKLALYSGPFEFERNKLVQWRSLSRYISRMM
jgi:hypothetical protein